MKTISRKTRDVLSGLLGDYEGLGFTLIFGSHSLLLQFKDTILHSFSNNNDIPLTADNVQAICQDYLNKINGQFN